MIHSEQPKGGQFKLVAGDLIRLIETQHEHQAEQLAKLGGLNTNDSADLKQREDTFGSNYIPPPKAKTLLELMWEAFQDITIIVLTISGILSVILAITVGDHPDTGWIEGACIIFAVLVVTMVTAINDYQKEAQFRALNAVKEDEKIKVIRNGVPAEVSKFGLVVGDVVRVDLGDIVPADGIVFDQKELKLDESAMTGESDLMMLVICVGESSQAGIIKKLILGKDKEKEKAKAKEAEKKTTPSAAATTPHPDPLKGQWHCGADRRSPLEAKLNRLTILIGKLGTTVALLVFIIMSIRFSVHNFTGDDKKEWKAKYISDYLQFFIVAITVLVVAIPEGLPLAVTISLAYSVKKMLTDNNLVRHLDACETMGSATTICSDKTGTLTTNRMTVMQIWIGGQEFSSASQATDEMSESTRDVFCNGVCVNSTAEILPSKVPGGQPEHTGNKTECALLQFVRDCGVDYSNVRANTEIGHMLTFSSKKKRMSVVVKRSASTCRIYTKGATEVVLGLCSKMKRLDGSVASLDGNQKDIIGTSIIEKFASKASTSAEEISQWSDDEVEKDLTCIAIVGIEDPVRKEVPDSIKLCHRAGIIVRMVTGDNITTARQEFRTRVLDGNGNIIQSEFDKIWPLLRVMALEPDALRPQVVAVTGDGTNDAPALKKANDASDIILMDDNFTSIVGAIKWGRNVYDSIAKFLMFQLTVNVVAISLAFLGAVILEQSPLTAVQLLWVNLIMDSFASLALATEPPTQALLERRPYPKTKPLLSKIMTKHIVGQSIYQLKMLDVPSGRFQDLDEDHKHDPTQHMTVIFNTFVWMQLFNELNCRKIHDEPNVLEGLLGNRVYIYVTLLQILMQLVIVQCTGSFFNCEPLTAGQWGVSIGLGAVSMPIRVVLRCLSAKWLPAFCQDAEAVDVQSFPPTAKAVRKGSSQKAIMLQ
ncbi:P-type ATPase, cytoplasmic domain N [Phytophthora cactorum]|nr:P-type ATPase, cytoplasmic domain N [Phytophthora cactorum]